jgi:photosystem I subunit 8
LLTLPKRSSQIYKSISLAVIDFLVDVDHQLVYIYIKQFVMAAAFLPSILVPIVGLVFPALSMALFFLYVSVDDIE